MSNQKTLYAQACRFQRIVSDDPDRRNSTHSWEPGIAFLEAFDVSDVSFIVDAAGKKVSSNQLYNYELLNLRVDGYIAITHGDYVGKVYRPMENT